MGLLIGLTLLFGVVAELTLLPLLILYFYKHRPKEIRQPVPVLGANLSILPEAPSLTNYTAQFAVKVPYEV
ncbi:hypothetical protein [Hymenobacter sp. HDW8]|uniref:hypothetical protein n=1 Tax=Hymenobacter sp. HDW8 TaxID=2714932 RepID=UPI001F0E98BC|nr:hypothetical protein [Hymenobacter sp. HDW8]